MEYAQLARTAPTMPNRAQIGNRWQQVKCVYSVIQFVGIEANRQHIALNGKLIAAQCNCLISVIRCTHTKICQDDVLR